MLNNELELARRTKGEGPFRRGGLRYQSGTEKAHTEAAERIPSWMDERVWSTETGSKEGSKGWQVLDIEGILFMKLRHLESIL